jgi:D-glycero-alpha-D-manno-heptose-7-phosphate kinase
MQEGIYVEQKVLKEVVGSQDQVSAAMGGFNVIAFEKNEEIGVHPVLLPKPRLEELEGSLMLFYTGILRTASTVATAYVTGLDAKKRQLRILKDLVDEAMEILTSHRSLNDFGALLDESWRIKKSLGGGISNPEVDCLYEKAQRAGAVGGKLTGAGGGGFLLFFVPPEKQASVKEALKDLVHVPFKFESSGTQIIFHETEEDYSEVERLIESQGIRDFRELEDLDLLPYSPAVSGDGIPETQEVQ